MRPFPCPSCLGIILLLFTSCKPGWCSQCRNGSHPWGDAIAESLQYFEKPITMQDIDDLQAYVQSRFPGGWRVLIQDQKLYAAPLGRFNTTATYDALAQGVKVDPFLLLIQKMLCLRHVPDVEFVYRSNNGNYGKTSRPLPMFYYSRTALREPGFLLPYKFTFLDMTKHRNMFVEIPWTEKISKGIFRGATSCGTYATNTWRSMPRTQLVWACRNRTDVCDGGFSKWAQITEGAKKAMEEEFHGLMPHVPMREYSRYKYIIVPDGNTAPTSRMATFFSNSAVIKQVTPVKEFFYSNLQPYVHYIPLSHKMTDIASVLDWAVANDDLAAAIARNARSWALTYLNNECVANYMKDVFDSYSRIMASDFVPGSSSFPYKEVKLNPRVAMYLGRSCAGLKGPCGSMNRR